MKPENLHKAIGDVDEDLIIESDALRPRHTVRNAAIILTACAVLLFTFYILPRKQDTEVIAQPTPETTEQAHLEPTSQPVMQPILQAEEYFEIKAASLPSQKNHGYFFEHPELAEAIDRFSEKSALAVLSDATNENRVFSPLSLWMAVSAMSELTQDDSQKELLELLGINDLSTLETIQQTMYETNNDSDRRFRSSVSSSLWLNNQIGYRKDLLEQLSQNLYLSTYNGEMGSSRMDEKLQEWINSATGNLLEESVNEIHTTVDTVMAFVNAVFFEAKWQTPFDASETRDGIFHSPAGDVSTPMMHINDMALFYRGEHFAAVCKSLQKRDLIMILPDDGYTVQDLLVDQEVSAFLRDASDATFLNVDLTMPRFRLYNDIDGKQVLEQMGIHAVFDRELADFEPLTDAPTYVTEVQHSATLSVDEEGVQGAAFTNELGAMGLAPILQTKIVFNKPFLTAVTGSGCLLFEGIVNIPEIGEAAVENLPPAEQSLEITIDPASYDEILRYAPSGYYRAAMDVTSEKYGSLLDYCVQSPVRLPAFPEYRDLWDVLSETDGQYAYVDKPGASVFLVSHGTRREKLSLRIAAESQELAEAIQEAWISGLRTDLCIMEDQITWTKENTEGQTIFIGEIVLP